MLIKFMNDQCDEDYEMIIVGFEMINTSYDWVMID